MRKTVYISKQKFLRLDMMRLKEDASCLAFVCSKVLIRLFSALSSTNYLDNRMRNVNLKSPIQIGWIKLQLFDSYEKLFDYFENMKAATVEFYAFGIFICIRLVGNAAELQHLDHENPSINYDLWYIRFKMYRFSG